MPEEPKGLSTEHRRAVLQLGNPGSDSEAIPAKVLAELMYLGLIHRRRSDGRLDFTDTGEALYEKLAGESGGKA